MPYTTGRMILAQSQKYAAGGTAWEIDINTAGTFTLLSSGTVDVDVYWGDGDVETVTTNSVDHTYPAPGTYTIGIKINSGGFYPYYNYDPAGDEVVTVGDTPAGWSFGTTLQLAFRGSGNLTTVGDIDTSGVSNFFGAWWLCTNLDNIAALGETYSFPLIDMSNATNLSYAWHLCTSFTSFPPLVTSNVTNFSNTWRDCDNLELFPEIDTSKGLDFSYAWSVCRKLNPFPELDLSSGTNFYLAWNECNALISFPELPASKRPDKGTRFQAAWRNCNSMTTFPPNFFDNWTGIPVSNCFGSAWEGCSSLTATSVENILNSIAASTGQQNAPGTNPVITINYNAGTGTPDITAAVANLQGRGWTITLNGVPQ